MDIRKTNPGPDNKYYLRVPEGWNPCILGNANNRLYPDSVLANCIGAAVGRFNELTRSGGCDLLGNRYPGALLDLARVQGLEIGDTPRPGCVVVMLKSDNLNGHVINIEKVSGGKYYTFESGWNYTPGVYISNRWVSKSNNFGMSTDYRFAGCIYNPCVDPYAFAQEYVNKWHRTGPGVKAVQWVLNREGCYEPGSDNSIDGSCGPATIAAIENYQRAHGLEVDGSAGPLTQAQMKNDWYII